VKLLACAVVYIVVRELLTAGMLQQSSLSLRGVVTTSLEEAMHSMESEHLCSTCMLTVLLQS
jgi:hypothetical protein